MKCYHDILLTTIIWSGEPAQPDKGGVTVEYMDMVGRIVAAEHTAKAMAEEGRQRQEQVQSGLEQEIAELRESYLERARHRIGLVEQAEQSGAEETIARLDQKQHQAMQQMEAVFEKNRDRWADTLFSMIVGVPV